MGEYFTGGLDRIIDAYHSGEDRKRAIEDRDRNWGQTNLKNDQEQAQHDPYNRVKRDEKGIPRGLEENTEYERRDQKPAATRFPEMFRKDAAPVNPARPAPATTPVGINKDFQPESTELSTSGRPMGKTDYTGNRAPNGEQSNDPKPLIADPALVRTQVQNEHAASQADAAHQNNMQLEEKRLESGKRFLVAPGTTKVQYDQNDPGKPAGRDPVTGKDLRIVNATQTSQEFPDQPVVVMNSGEAGATTVQRGPNPAVPESPEDYNPSPYMRKRITDAATTVPRFAQHQNVALASLPKGLRDKLGIPDDSREVIPSDILKAWLGGEYKVKGAGAGKVLPPEVLPYIQDVESGNADAAEGLAAFNADHPEIPITPEVARAFTQSKGNDFRAKGQADANTRFEKGQAKKDQTAYLGMVGKASDQWNKAAEAVLAETNYARTAKALVNQKDTKGVVGAVQQMMARAGSEKGPLSKDDLARTPGAEDWEERAQQFISAASGEGMTPENIKIVNRIADVYIKAAQNKARALAKPIVGGLRSRAQAYGMDPDEAERLFRSEMDLDLGGASAPEEKAAPEQGGLEKLKSQYQAALKKIDASGANASQKRIAKQKAFEFYKSKGGR